MKKTLLIFLSISSLCLAIGFGVLYFFSTTLHLENVSSQLMTNVEMVVATGDKSQQIYDLKEIPAHSDLKVRLLSRQKGELLVNFVVKDKIFTVSCGSYDGWMDQLYMNYQDDGFAGCSPIPDSP